MSHNSPHNNNLCSATPHGSHLECVLSMQLQALRKHEHKSEKLNGSLCFTFSTSFYSHPLSSHISHTAKKKEEKNHSIFFVNTQRQGGRINFFALLKKVLFEKKRSVYTLLSLSMFLFACVRERE